MGAHSGYTADVNTTNFPSCDHCALSASVAMLVSFFALLVAPVSESKSAVHTCCDPSRLDSHRIRFPSHENCGPPSPGCATAIFSGSPPSIFCSHSSGVFVFFARSTVVTEYASHLPSGETAVSPSRFMAIMSSKVMGRFVCANPAGKRAARRANGRRDLDTFIEPANARENLFSREGKVYNACVAPGQFSVLECAA